MTRNDKKTFRKVIAIAMMIVSGFFAINVLVQNLHGIFSILAVVVVVFLLKTAEATFAADAAEEFKTGNYWLGSGYLALCTVLFLVSISGSTIYWFGNHKKDSAKLDEAKAFLVTKEKDVTLAQEQLNKCKPGHVTKCIKPMSEIVTAKQLERDAAAAKVTKLAEIQGMDKAWKEVAAFVGLGNEEDASNLEIFRDFILSALADIIAMIFIAQAESGKRQSQLRKNDLGGGDDYLDTDFSPVQNSREPLRIADSQELLSSLLSKKSEMENENSPKSNAVLDACRVDRMLVVGKMGAGKTSLMAHIAEQKAQSGLVLILDPHAAGQWPKNCQIVGGGRNYQEIESMLKTVIAEMDNRFKQIHNGSITERDLQPITVLFDEFTSINSKLKNAGQDYLLPLLTEGRKAAIHVIAGGQDETAGALGLKGFFGLKNAFDLVLRCKNVNGNRSIEFDNSESRVVYEHPGVFVSNSENSREAASLNASQYFKPVFEEILDKDKVRKTVIKDAVNKLGKPTDNPALQNQPGYTSYGKLSQHIWGRDKRGSHYNRMIDEALSESESESESGFKSA